MNIYMTGVGGQGIGLLSEVLLRAIDHSGETVRGVDTHGLAQRGGVVVSQIRTGTEAFSPLIAPGEADLVLALERHEALRGTNAFLADGGALAYYDAVWQPYEVRCGTSPEVTVKEIEELCTRRSIKLVRVYLKDLPDPRMQNTALLGEAVRGNLIPGLTREHLAAAFGDILKGAVLERNLSLL